MTWAGHVARMEEGADTEFRWENLKRPRRRPGRRWEDNIKVDLQGIGWEGVDSGLGQVAAGICECSNEHSGSIKSGQLFWSNDEHAKYLS